MKPRSRNDNLRWISDAYEQEVGDGNWKKVTPLLETKLKKIPILSGSSSTSIKTYRGTDINVNDKLLVRTSTSPDVWSQISIEGITEVAGDLSVSNAKILTQRSNNTGDSALYIASGSIVSTTYARRGGVFSPDGLNLYTSQYEGDVLNQFSLSTPFDVETAVATSKSVSLQGINSNGFFFANNGRYLFVNAPATTGNYTLRRNELAIPWDISSIIDYVDMVNPVTGATTPLYRMMNGVFSEDGTKWMMTDAGATTTISWGTTQTPFGFDGTKANGQWTETSSTFVANNVTDVEKLTFTSDGKHIVHLYDDSIDLNLVALQICTLETPFDLTGGAVFSDILLDTMSSSPYTEGYLVASTSNNDESSVWVSDDLRYIVLQSKLGHDDILTLETTFGGTLSLDISTQGLSSTPENDYVYLLPQTEFSLATASSSSATWAATERVATTALGVSGSTIVSDKSNLIEVGDTLLLNGTDEVTVTAVTETTGGQAKIEMDAVGGMKFIQEKTLRTTWMNNSTQYSGYTKFQISGNGEKLFLAAGASSSTVASEIGIYVYDMTTPWDISTLVPNPYKHKYNASDLGHHNVSATDKYFEAYFSYNNGPIGLQFSPDGKKLTYATMIGGESYAWIITLNLSIPWDLESVTSKSYTIESNYFLGNQSSTNTKWKDVVFNEDGSQAWLSLHYVGNTQSYFQRYDLTTPYDISSGITIAAQAPALIISKNVISEAGLIKRLSPDGTQIISMGSGMYNRTNNLVGGDHDYFYKNTLLTPGDFGSIQNGTAMNLPNEGDIGYIVCDHQFSPDGTRWYFINANGNLYEYEVKQKTLNSYAVTYATQGSAPTSIYLKDKSSLVTFDSMTVGTLDSDLTTSVDWTVSTPITTDARAIKMKLEGGSPDFDIETIRLDLDKNSS